MQADISIDQQSASPAWNGDDLGAVPQNRRSKQTSKRMDGASVTDKKRNKNLNR